MLLATQTQEPIGSRWRVPATSPYSWLFPLLLLALCAGLYFWRLGLTPLDDFDEAYYAEGAREMLEQGDLGTPYYNGRPFLLKPILIYWLIAAAFRLFGVTEFAARSVSAFFATVVVMVTYWFGVRAMNRRTGLLAALALALSYQWLDTGREAMIDMPLTAAVAGAMFLFFLATQASPGKKRQLYLSAYPLIGIGLLAKGPVACTAALLGLLTYLLITKQLRAFLREAHVPIGIALALAVAAPWYVYEALREPEFIPTFLLREHFGHLRGELARDEPWWGHFKNLLVGFYPWVAFLPAALVHAFRSDVQPCSGGAPPEQPRANVLGFCACWALAVLAVFSFGGAKLPHYLVPAFPPMAIIVAAWLDAWQRNRTRGRLWPAAGFAVLVFVGLLLSAAAILAVVMPSPLRERLSSQFGSWTPGPAPVVMLCALALGSLTAVAAAASRRRSLVFPALAVAVIVAGLAHIGWLKPRLAQIQAQPRKELAQLAAALPEDEPLGVYYAKRNATIFYARRPIVDLGEWDPDRLVSFLSSPTPATALTHVKFAPLLERELPEIAMWTRRGDFVLVSNHAPPVFGARRRAATSGSQAPSGSAASPRSSAPR